MALQPLFIRGWKQLSAYTLLVFPYKAMILIILIWIFGK